MIILVVIGNFVLPFFLLIIFYWFFQSCSILAKLLGYLLLPLW